MSVSKFVIVKEIFCEGVDVTLAKFVVVIESVHVVVTDIEYVTLSVSVLLSILVLVLLSDMLLVFVAVSVNIRDGVSVPREAETLRVSVSEME